MGFRLCCAKWEPSAQPREVGSGRLPTERDGPEAAQLQLAGVAQPVRGGAPRSRTSSQRPPPPNVLAPFLKDLLTNTYMPLTVSQPAVRKYSLHTRQFPPLLSPRQTLAHRGEGTRPGSPASKWPRQDSEPGCLCPALSSLPLVLALLGSPSLLGYYLCSQVVRVNRIPAGVAGGGGQALSVQLGRRSASPPGDP